MIGIELAMRSTASSDSSQPISPRAFSTSGETRLSTGLAADCSSDREADPGTSLKMIYRALVNVADSLSVSEKAEQINR